MCIGYSHTIPNPNTGTSNINPHTPSVKIIAKYGLIYMPYSQYSALCWVTVLGNPSPLGTVYVPEPEFVNV
jgi:hypothetical protein